MNSIKNTSSSYSYITIPLLSILYLYFSKITFGLRTDHFVLVVIVNFCYFLSISTRRLIIGLGIIIVYWIIYDSMKVWPNWAFNEVDILPLYNLEKYLFGIREGNNFITPNEFFLSHSFVFADIICGAFYLCWMPLPLFFAFYLYFKNKNLFLRFSMAFFIVNCIGFVIYYLHPAAPPWYYEKYGSVLDVTTKSNAAGLLRFDTFFGIHLFEDLYSKGSNVFAAMPSLHSSYPLIGLIYAFKHPEKWLKILFATVMVGIWFSAIYLSHHYILDVIVGIACGLLGIYFFEKVMLRNEWFKKFMKKYEDVISNQ